MNSEYRKFAEQVAADASQAASGRGLEQAFAWLAGDWIWGDRQVSFVATGYGLAHGGDPFLIHNEAAGMWVLVLADPAAYGILIGMGLRNGAASFVGAVTIDEEAVELRQSWRRLDDDTLEIVNARRSAGRWVVWDRSLLSRRRAAS